MTRSFAAAALLLSVGACLNPVNVGSMTAAGTTGGGSSGSACGSSCVPISPAQLDFGQVPIGQTATLDVTFSDCGSAAETIVLQQPTGAQASELQVVGPATLSLAPCGSETVGISFTPSAAGSATASLPFSPCAGCASEDLTVSGVGQTGLFCTPDPIDFGIVAAGGSSVIPVRCSNETGTAISITSVGTFSGAPPFTVSAAAVPFSVAPGASFVATVTYQSNGETGVLTDQLLVAFTVPSDPSIPPRTVSDPITEGSSGGSSSSSSGGSCLAGGSNCTGSSSSCCAGLTCVQSPTEHEFACCGGSNSWAACAGLGSSGSTGSSGGGSCSGTVVLASSQTFAFGIAVNSTNVYWTDTAGGYSPSGGGSVKTVPICGGNVTTLASGLPSPTGIAIDSTHVYWVNDEPDIVMSALLDGGASTVLVTNGNQSPLAIAVDGTSVYWTANALPGEGSGAVMSVPKAGGSPVTLATGQADPWGIAIDSQNVYWANANIGGDGLIMSVPLDGGTPVTLASGPFQPAYLAVDVSSVYWTSVDGTIASVPKGGGTPTTLASGPPGAQGIAVDTESVYWTAPGNVGGDTGYVLSVPKGGGAPTTLATAQDDPTGIAVDGTNVYWTDQVVNDAGYVMEAPK